MSRDASENKSCVSGTKELSERASDRGWKKFEKRPKFETLVSWSCSVSCHPQKDRIKKKKKQVRNEIYAEKNCSALLRRRITSVPVLPGTETCVRGLYFKNMAQSSMHNYSKKCAIES